MLTREKLERLRHLEQTSCNIEAEMRALSQLRRGKHFGRHWQP